MEIKRITREIKKSCTTIKNSLMAKKKYSLVKKGSPFIEMFLLYLKREGLILGFNKKEEGYYVNLNVRESSKGFNLHQGLGGRKLKRKVMSSIPYYGSGRILLYSPQSKRILSLEESYELGMGGVVLGTILLS